MKKLIIELMLDFANDYDHRILNDLTQPNKIMVLNTMVFLSIYQKFAQNYRYDPETIQEYFNFDEYEFYVFNASCSWLKKFKIIDDEFDWIMELLPVDSSYIYTIMIDRNDIGNSTIEFFTLQDGVPLSSSERTFTFKPKQSPAPFFEPIKPKSTLPARPKSKNRIIKKNSREPDFDR